MGRWVDGYRNIYIGVLVNTPTFLRSCTLFWHRFVTFVQMLGATNPLDAEVGTIRGDLCTNAGKFLCVEGITYFYSSFPLLYAHVYVTPVTGASD